jgi:hypothetical protein
MNLKDIRKLSCFGYSAFLFSCLFSGKGASVQAKKNLPSLAKEDWEVLSGLQIMKTMHECSHSDRRIKTQFCRFLPGF